MTDIQKIITPDTYPEVKNEPPITTLNMLPLRTDKTSASNHLRFHKMPENFKFRQNVEHDYVITMFDPRTEQFLNSLNRSVLAPYYTSSTIASNQVFNPVSHLDLFSGYAQTNLPSVVNSHYISELRAGKRSLFQLGCAGGSSALRTDSFHNLFYRGFGEFNLHIQGSKTVSQYLGTTNNTHFVALLTGLLKLGIATDKINFLDPVSFPCINFKTKNEYGFRLINVYEAKPNLLYCLSYILYVPGEPSKNVVFHIWLNRYAMTIANTYADDIKYLSTEYAYHGVPRLLNNIILSKINCFIEEDGSIWHILDGEKPIAIALVPSFADRVKSSSNLMFFQFKQTYSFESANWMTTYFCGKAVVEAFRYDVSKRELMKDSVLFSKPSDPHLNKQFEVIANKLQGERSVFGVDRVLPDLTPVAAEKLFAGQYNFADFGKLKIKDEISELFSEEKVTIKRTGLVHPEIFTKPSVLHKFL